MLVSSRELFDMLLMVGACNSCTALGSALPDVHETRFAGVHVQRVNEG